MSDIEQFLGSIKNAIESIKIRSRSRRVLLEGHAPLPTPRDMVEEHVYSMHEQAERAMYNAHVEGFRKFREMQPEAFGGMLLQIKSLRIRLEQVSWTRSSCTRAQQSMWPVQGVP